MALDTASLEPVIYRILTAPGTDLSTISAKRVRRQLAEEGTLPTESIKEHKEVIDALITKVFERVNTEQHQAEEEEEEDEAEDYSAGEDSHTSRKRHYDDNDTDDDEGDRESPPPTKKAKKSSSHNSKKLTDEALARKLSNEINGRTTRTGKAGGTKARGTSKVKPRKSAATVDTDEDSDNGAATKKKKSKKRSSGSTEAGGARGGFAKEFVLSGALATVVQAEKMSRPQVVKQLWAYIKGNELQNPRDKREILCDANLKAVFGKEKVSMFGMNKILGQHLHEPET